MAESSLLVRRRTSVILIITFIIISLDFSCSEPNFSGNFITELFHIRNFFPIEFLGCYDFTLKYQNNI